MRYIIKNIQEINIFDGVQNPVIKELLGNYTFSKINWKITYKETRCITLGEFEKTDSFEGEFVINVTKTGVYIGGKDELSLMRGFTAFLEMIKYDEKQELFYVESGVISHKPALKLRCVHLCIFPETEIAFMKKCIRSCAVAKYSHIILEFWGMLKYDCMKELSWPFAYTKEQIKELVAEANSLGMEIIPMFNHLGHASMSREINGKHVVLDQKPEYGYLFDSYGWVWNLEKEEVLKLLKKIRQELIEVCGKGSYFHIGCDEVYAYGKDIKKAEKMADYINCVNKELNSLGRKCIMWHDMLLPGEDFKGYTANSNKEVSQLLLNKLDKSIIIADWEYVPTGEIWKSAKVLKENGFSVLCCPWEGTKNINEAIETAKELQLHGIIHTTWHTLYKGFRDMLYAGILSYGMKSNNMDDILRFYTAEIARRVLPSGGEYGDSGWNKYMTGPGV